MPELTECMYAHQQIYIPPTFPYILRQYAKAAIRSQPTDLLKWSTAYFRCLALQLPPPVKPRLEYPIKKTHYGLSPGWLKTLLKQLAGYQTVSWPLLVDRWQGACLDIAGLVEILMTAGFPNPGEIPWYRFVAVAAGFLMPNLTQTMILICELLTEQPEGGSSMILAGIFNDLYQFLAELDASAERTVRNFYFTESNLDLTKREIEGVSETIISEGVQEEVSKISVETEQESEKVSTRTRSTVSAETTGPQREPSVKQVVSHTGETLTASSEGSGPEGYVLLHLPAVPGIGPAVPSEIIKAVLKYVLEMSLIQQGMFMPRNIRHFTCPPLEIMETKTEN